MTRGPHIDYFAVIPEQHIKYFFSDFEEQEWCDTCAASTTVLLCVETGWGCLALLPLCRAHRAPWRADLERYAQVDPRPDSATASRAQAQAWQDRSTAREALWRALMLRVTAHYATMHPERKRELQFDPLLLHRLIAHQYLSGTPRRGAPLGKGYDHGR